MTGRRFRCLVLCAFLIFAGSAARAGGPASADSVGKAAVSLDDLAGAEIGVQTGMICDVLTQQRIPDTRIRVNPRRRKPETILKGVNPHD